MAPKTQRSGGRQIARWLLATLVVLIFCLAVGWAWREYAPLPLAQQGDAALGAEAFYHSDLGSGGYSAIPKVIFDAIPELFPEELPEGWEGIGFLWPEGVREGPPIGLVAGSFLGLELYSPNCAVCHVGRFGKQLVAGAPNYDFDAQRLRHLMETAFTSDKLSVESLSKFAAARGEPLHWLRRLELGFILRRVRAVFSKQPQGWFKNNLGPGRSDALVGWKATLNVAQPEDISWVRFPPLYNQRLKQKTLYDGSITGDLATRIMLTEVQKGRPYREPLRDRQVFDDLWAYLKRDLRPPPYPFAVDRQLAAEGEKIFAAQCAECHGTYGAKPTYPNLRVMIDYVSTDPARARAMTPAVADALERTPYGPFLRVEPSEAYLAPPLDGIYLSYPYLHNGSVPTLRDLLTPAAERPVSFYRRWNEFDPVRVGLRCEALISGACGPDATQRSHDPRTLFFFDTRVPGNWNTGHTYGVFLSAADKLALLEYLKTL